MKRIFKTLTTALLCATLASPVMAQPSAVSIGGLAQPTQLSNPAEPIASRNRRSVRRNNNDFNSNNNFSNLDRNRNRSHNRRSNRRGHGGNIGLGLGAAIIGGILLSGTARAHHRRTHAGDWNRCARTYRSFEWDTGMYTVRRGVRRTCPYLR